MGTWGPKLYQDDVTADVRDYYIDQLRRGKSNEEVYNDILLEFKEYIEDDDDRPLFWFALADTQWKYGRLLDTVKEKALEYLKEGTNLARWKEESTLKDYELRKKVLQELEYKLNSEMPQEKKISQYKIYKCEWNIGDVFAYKLESEYAKVNNLYGRYLIFQKVDEGIWHPGHVIPIVRFKITNDTNLPRSKDEIDKLKYIKITFQTINNNVLYVYLMKLATTSKRIIPKKLIYLGNYKGFRLPENEYIEKYKINIPTALWKDFEEYIINRMKYRLNEYI